MTRTERAILDFYQTKQEREQDRCAVAHPDSTADLIARIQRGARGSVPDIIAKAPPTPIAIVMPFFSNSAR